MTQPIFVKVRNDQGNLYDSYTDYWRLVELSGFATCELDEVKQKGPGTYIYSPDNGNVKAHLAALVAYSGYKHILWQLERPGQVGAGVPHLFDEMWLSDRYYADHWHPLNPRARYVPMGGHTELGQTPSLSKQWDFVHLSYLYGLRDAKVGALAAMGFTMAPNGWGAARDISLAESRYGLCLHQDEIPVIEPLRFTLFSCWQLPLITDISHDYYPYQVTPLNDMAQFVNLDNPDGFNAAVDVNYKLLTEDLTFRHCVETALT